MDYSEISSPDELEESVAESVKEKLKSKEPSEEEKDQLEQQHQGHLVRDTTSELEVESIGVTDGIKLNGKAEIPDTYCFSCEEWIGFSGVNLRGTPRSKREAYYLGGMPNDVYRAKNGTRETITELAEKIIDRVEQIETLDDAYEFIETVIEEEKKNTTSNGESNQ